MKKTFTTAVLAACAALTIMLATGCTQIMPDLPDAGEQQIITVSNYPVYIIADNLVRNVPGITLECLTQPQADCLRSYQLSEWDITALMASDAFIFGGRGLESYVAGLDQLEDAPALIEIMSDIALINEGAQAQDEDEDHFTGENPWLFLSTSGAGEMAEHLYEKLSILDPSYSDMYAENLSDFLGRLSIARREMAGYIEPVADQPVALMHEGLTYFAEEWGLNVVVTSKREPGTYFGDVELNEALESFAEAKVRAVLIELQAPASLTRAIAEAGFSVALIDTLSTGRPNGNAYAYEEAMLNNAIALNAALIYEEE